MKSSDFQKLIQNSKYELQKLFYSKLPRLVGKHAVDHFKENFQKGGFVNKVLHKWDTPKRYKEAGKYAYQKYGTLLSARKELYNSITYRAGFGIVVILSDKEYAQIHNEGGTINHPGGTPYFYDKKKKQLTYVSKAKGEIMKLPKTQAHKIEMPKRQFIGESYELNLKIKKIINNEVLKILKRK